MLDSQRLDDLRTVFGGDSGAEALLQRLRRRREELEAGLRAVSPAPDALLDRLLDVMRRAHHERPPELRHLDETRPPDWLQRPELLGYVCYADRFVGSLEGVGAHAPYLEELGVKYLHLLQPRLDPGGLGTLTRRLRARGISLCLDLPVPGEASQATAPDLFLESVERMLSLANQGVEALRLEPPDAPGTPPLAQALRAVLGVVAPAVALAGPAGSDLRPHEGLMVQLWSSLASQDIRLFEVALGALASPPPSAPWATYLRGPDALRWAIRDEDALQVGVTGEGHRRFLRDYYSGQFWGSPARGVPFASPSSEGEPGTCGSAASLAGLEKALSQHDPGATQESLDRLLLGHAVVLGFGGVPLVYMGDEIALLNDWDYSEEPAHAADGRWLHRPRMDWSRAEQARTEPYTIAGRMYAGLRALISARQRTPHLHAAVASHVVPSPNRHVLLLERAHASGPLVAVYNFSDLPQQLPTGELLTRGLSAPVDRISGKRVPLGPGPLRLAPYARLWLTAPEG